MERAGVALSFGALIVIARVTGPHTSHRGEVQGAALVTAPNLAELVWERKRDIFDFYVARCAAPRGVKRTRNVDGAPTFWRKKARA